MFSESIVERLPGLVRSGQSRFFVYGGKLPIQAIARGVATAFPERAQIVELASDYLRPRDGSMLLAPLLAGRTLVLIHTGNSTIPGRLAEHWPEFVQNPRAYHAKVTDNLVLNFRVHIKQPGALVVIQETPRRSGLRSGADIWQLERYAAELAAAGSEIDIPISTVGVQRTASTGVITKRDLCLLHNRDPKYTPRFSVEALMEAREGPLTWTDLQEVIRSAGSSNVVLDWFYQAGRVDDEKYEFARAAVNMLKVHPELEHSSLGYPIFPTIYDLVWERSELDDGQYILRGQLDAKWTQESTLLRYKRNGEPLDVGELLARVQTTEAFLAVVRKRQSELFDRELDEESLLAVAQHYGFPTPLLDYTRSLRVAAFFATLGARDLPANDRRVGVIYYMNSNRAEFGAGRDPAETIGLPGFSLLDAARIRLGAIRVIEPDLPDDDNRIVRQSGVFIGGFQSAGLQSVAIDRLYFRQSAGEEFEDAAVDITREYLLPDKSPLAQLAEKVSNDLGARPPSSVHAEIRSTRIPERGIVGAVGDDLFAHIREASQFFESLSSYISQHNLSDSVATQIRALLEEYFEASRVRADAGEAPPQDEAVDDTGPLNAFVRRLAALTETDEDSLLKDVNQALSWEPYANEPSAWAVTLVAKPPLERLAFACAMYVAAWERLQHVDGEVARHMAYGAFLVLTVTDQ